LTGAWSLANLLSGWLLNTWTLRLTFALGTFVPTSAIYWLAEFCFGARKGKVRYLTIAFLVGSCALALSSLFTSVIASGTADDVVTGSLFPLYALFLASGIIISIVLSVRHYRQSVGIVRLQSRYVVWGVTLFGVSAFFVSFFLPILGITAFGRLDSVTSLFFAAFSAYAIIAHRLMDARVIIRKSAIYLGLAVFTFVAYYSVLWVDNMLFHGSYTVGGYLSAIVFAPLFLFAFSKLHRWFERFTNRHFFTSLYDYQGTLETFARRISGTIRLEEVTTLITETVRGTMGLDDVAVLTRTTGRNPDYHVVKALGFKSVAGGESLAVLPWDKVFRDVQTSIVVDEPSGSHGQDSLSGNAWRSQLESMGVTVCIPMRTKGKLMGSILLGNKVTHDAYTKEDLELLDTLTNQAAIAVENARLYNSMEQLVAEQTKAIKDQNIHLQELLKMKSEFLQIASHQLRTPLSAIRGLLSMQADGDFDRMPKQEVKTQQQRMLESSNRLSNIVNDLLDAMELEGGYLNFEFAPTDLGEMITAIMRELQPNYDRKGLYVRLVQPKEPLPKVEAEPKYLREALENFIDNAEKYTNKGGTTVTLSKHDNHAIISITDTGIGIPKTDMPKLFQKFSRGEKSTYQHTDGSGLGLFIAKNIIDEHRGTINIDSPGEGNGTTITVTLPLTQPSLPKNNNKK
jgi:signal transduction histidine kinase